MLASRLELCASRLERSRFIFLGQESTPRYQISPRNLRKTLSKFSRPFSTSNLGFHLALMAPKRKSIAQRPMKAVRKVAHRGNQPTSSSSSSSLPLPTVPSSNPLTGRPVTTGRMVDFEFFRNEGFSLGAKLINLGFQKFCSLEVPTYPAMVQEFYSTAGRGDGGLIADVKGKKVRITQSILSSLLELPTEGAHPTCHSARGAALSRMLGRNVHDMEEISANQLPLEVRVLHNICGRILFPKTGRFDFVSEKEIAVLDCILNGHPVNLPGMMITYMTEATQKKKASLPYGMVLTLIFRSQDIPIAENEPKKVLRHTDYYNESTLHRMGYKKVNGIWEKKMTEEQSPVRRAARTSDDHPAASTSSPPPAAAAAPAPSTIDSFTVLRDLIISEHETTRRLIKSESQKLEAKIEELKTQLEEQNAEIEALKSQLKKP